MPGLVGVVLCGGHSRRMGRDKGLFPGPEGVTTWAGRALSLLRDCGLDAIVSVREAQLARYGALLGPENFVVDREVEGGGPLSGFAAAHARRPDCDLLMLACDMPDLDRDLLSPLLAAYAQLSPRQRGIHAIAFNTEPPEPLCAIYGRLVLDRLMKYRAPKAILLGENVLRIPIPPDQRHKLHSKNDPAALQDGLSSGTEGLQTYQHRRE
ncbi:MAG: NTP transferase domain-containing protein [Spirochaetales bacterium]|nr:NTP transferase domain-containing protein [Leptospiraceae bacterium]MCP5481264.1 NTP transferase domain-containing protein [Spirochaetales bacterium]MCP5485700.1 NTP transferase domain-containing protein [Spirochaetales bacterium]